MNGSSQKNSVYNFKKVIDDIVDTNLINKGITKYISAKVVSVNSNGTVNVYIPPDTTNKINGLANKSGEVLFSGDSVELCAKNGSVKNSWIAVKHGIGTVGGSGTNYDALPVGSIVLFSGIKAPVGYLFCMGQEVSRTERKDLFAEIGTIYGEGDGTTTFNLPNLCGKVPVGLDVDNTKFNSLGKTGGEETHTLTIDEIPSHSHNNPCAVTYNGDAATYRSLFATNSDFWKRSDSNNATASTGGSQPHNNLQPYITVNYIIKASGTAILQGNVVDSLDSDSTSNAPSIHAVNEGLLDKYSTTEAIVGVWIDGKTIYRKTVKSTYSATQENFTLLSNISTLVKGYGYCKGSGGTKQFVPMPNAFLQLNSSNQIVLNAINMMSIEYEITLEYTKTTD